MADVTETPAPPRKPKPRTQPDEPWKLPPTEPADIFALQAFAKGIANEGQQQRAWQYLTRTLCPDHLMTFHPGGQDGDRATAFAEGRRWVGNQLRRIEKLRPENKDREFG